MTVKCCYEATPPAGLAIGVSGLFCGGILGIIGSASRVESAETTWKVGVGFIVVSVCLMAVSCIFMRCNSRVNELENMSPAQRNESSLLASHYSEREPTDYMLAGLNK